jgi:hypothetical protein
MIEETVVVGDIMETTPPAEGSEENEHTSPVKVESDWHTPPSEPPSIPVTTASVPEPERPKVWNVNAQKWVDPETGE